MRGRGEEHLERGRWSVRAGHSTSHRQVLGAGFPRAAWIVSSSTQRACAVTTGAADAVTARSARDGRMDSRNCANRLTITQAGKSTARTNVCGTRVSGDPGAASFPGDPAAANRRLTSISLGKTLPNVDRQQCPHGAPRVTIRALGRARTPVPTSRTAGARPPSSGGVGRASGDFFRPARTLRGAFGPPPNGARAFDRRPFARVGDGLRYVRESNPPAIRTTTRIAERARLRATSCADGASRAARALRLALRLAVAFTVVRDETRNERSHSRSRRSSHAVVRAAMRDDRRDESSDAVHDARRDVTNRHRRKPRVDDRPRGRTFHTLRIHVPTQRTSGPSKTRRGPSSPARTPPPLQC